MHTDILHEIIAKADTPEDFPLSAKATTRAISAAVVNEIEGGRYLPKHMSTIVDGVEIDVDIRDEVVPDKRFVVAVSAFETAVSAFGNPRGDRFVAFATADGFATV